MAPTVAVDEAGEDSLRTVLLKNADTGATVAVPEGEVKHNKLSSLRRRLRLGDVQSAWLSGAESDVTVDPVRRTYRFARYPPLGFLINVRWYIILGAFLIAGLARVQFLFPCGLDYTAVTHGASSFCVPNDRLGSVTPSSCPADICSKRIPVTLQTYAVLLNGAIAGRTGALATALYVLMVCVGAPFGSNGKVDPVWERGAIVGSNGGYFVGFILASYIMGRCAEKGHDRPRSGYWMIPWMLLAEVAIYAFGLFWLPFGMAIARRISPASVCPDSSAEGVRVCLKNIANWGLVPFIPGELLKMLLVLITVPLAWQVLLAYHRWRGLPVPLPPMSQTPGEEEAMQAAAGNDMCSTGSGEGGLVGGAGAKQDEEVLPGSVDTTGKRAEERGGEAV